VRVGEDGEVMISSCRRSWLMLVDGGEPGGVGLRYCDGNLESLVETVCMDDVDDERYWN
jgi:hypothetical protein